MKEEDSRFVGPAPLVKPLGSLSIQGVSKCFDSNLRSSVIRRSSSETLLLGTPSLLERQFAWLTGNFLRDRKDYHALLIHRCRGSRPLCLPEPLLSGPSEGQKGRRALDAPHWAPEAHGGRFYRLASAEE